MPKGVREEWLWILGYPGLQIEFFGVKLSLTPIIGVGADSSSKGEFDVNEVFGVIVTKDSHVQSFSLRVKARDLWEEPW